MKGLKQGSASTFKVVLAFAIVYLVWGSTYLFIRLAILHIPALLMAGMRFFTAGLLLITWCRLRGEKVFVKESIRPAVVSGLLLLFFGNGAVVWGEQFLPSSFVAVLTAASPVWFIVLDKRNWTINFRNRETVIGLVTGFAGVLLLFSESASKALHTGGNGYQLGAIGILVVGAASWAGGSLYSKYNTTEGSHSVVTAWQMISAGAAFFLVSSLMGEWNSFHWQDIPSGSWFSLAYLISFGSLAGYSAYTWLLQVRPATQVSTHAYVNPTVAVILGVSVAGESLTALQWVGLTIILGSVLLINLSKYRKLQQPDFSEQTEQLACKA